MKTTFKIRVLAVVRKIKVGHVMTYKEVARRAGSPRAYRAVGSILNANYDPEIPCHRVIKSNGFVGGYNKGSFVKRERLRSEGVMID